METILTNEYIVNERQFETLAKKAVIGEYCQKIYCLQNKIAEIYQKGGKLKIDSRRDFFDLDKGFFYSFEGKIKKEIPGWVRDEDFTCLLKKSKLPEGYKAEFPELEEIKRWKDEFTEACGNVCFICVSSERKQYAYRPATDRASLFDNGTMTIVPVIRMKKQSSDGLLEHLLTFGLIPEGLTKEEMMCLEDLIKLKKSGKDYWSIGKDGVYSMNEGKLLNDFMKNMNDKLVESLHFDLTEILRKYCDKKFLKTNIDIREELLNCEKDRADIEPYEERILTDPNRGHWDLWKEQNGQNGQQYTLQLEENFIARNPLSDINENGVIAIDFGTKSTVVVYQSDIEHSLPMGIGDGNLSKAPTVKRFENPTVMHFVNLEKFLTDYRGGKGRPKTKWEDLTISHTAMEQFETSKSEEYYEYMHQIKQWAGQREKQFRIRPHEGKTIVLSPFLELKENEINPIELYAYYIGLYINNMRKGHGIFLDYYLSFPVTYETRIREKIVKSFEKGLKKSLPSAVLNNPEVMKKFHVNGEISEPMAYAVCALQEYGFDPEGDEEIFYGIFDFGGGTTDFDFGLWKQSSKRRYDYSIENFGAGGDEFLGGENLLEMLAFEIFKENRELMREKGYAFTLAPKSKEFLGSDALLADSQEAEKNMHNLMEVLRPYWETEEIESKQKESEELASFIRSCLEAIRHLPNMDKIEKRIDQAEASYKEGKSTLDQTKNAIRRILKEYRVRLEDIRQGDQSVENLELVVTLFDREGKDHPNEVLKYTREKINQFIEEKIRDGVNNFFSALLLSYQNERVKKPATVNILLAGNSCKSPIVKKVFEEEIEIQKKNIRKKYPNMNTNEKLFEIFPPLGTKEAYAKMKERNVAYSENDFEKPTGKTGVAFGLLQCRAGGVIERIFNRELENEVPFQYFIGWRSKKKFVVFQDDEKTVKYKGKPDYHVWYKFIEADAEVFDLYYTTLPECVKGNLAVDGNAAVKRYRCNIDVVDENAFVYIRAVDPHTLEYVVAKNSDVEKSKLGQIFKKELR